MFGLSVRIFLLFGLFSLAWVACSPPPASLKMSLYYPYGADGTAVFSKIKTFRLRLDGATLENKREDGEFDAELKADRPILSAIPCTNTGNEQLDVQLLGLDAAQQVVAAGRQNFVNACGKARELRVFVAPVDTFSSLSKIEGGIAVPEQMIEERAGHQITQLPDGRLLISGGGKPADQGGLLSTSRKMEIFDPETGQITDGISMSEERAFHTVTVVQNTILIAGGVRASSLGLESVRSVDIFELGEDGLVRKSGFEMEEGRAFHTATITPNATNLLLFGGFSYRSDGVIAMAKRWEIYSLTGSLVAAGDIAAEEQRAWHTANLLVDGRVFFLGGMQLDAQGQLQALSSALSLQFDSFDSSPTFLPQPNAIRAARAAHTTTRLLNGQIVVVGGMLPQPNSPFIPQSTVAEIQSFSPLGEINTGYTGALKQARTFHSSHLLEDGRLLVYGGLRGANDQADRAEIFLPGDLVLEAEPTLLVQRKDRFWHASAILLNGSVMILGGATLNPEGSPLFVALSRGEIFVPHPRR